MEQITNPRLAEDLKALNTSPAPDDPVDNDGVLVKDSQTSTRTSRSWAISTPRSSPAS